MINSRANLNQKRFIVIDDELSHLKKMHAIITGNGGVAVFVQTKPSTDRPLPVDAQVLLIDDRSVKDFLTRTVSQLLESHPDSIIICDNKLDPQNEIRGTLFAEELRKHGYNQAFILHTSDEREFLNLRYVDGYIDKYSLLGLVTDKATQIVADEVKVAQEKALARLQAKGAQIGADGGRKI